MSQPAKPRKAYPTDLTDSQWELLATWLDADHERKVGRPREVPLREVVNAILYLNRTGCQWDMLPHDFPPKSTVYDYFSKWRNDGTWETLVDALRQNIRQQEGREPTPSAVCIDSQSVKTTEVGGEDRGYDGGKKIKGRKRHLLVDTLGLLIAVVITGANVDDGAAASRVVNKISQEDFPRIKTIFGDNKYNNKGFQSWLESERPGWKVEVSSRPEGSRGFCPVRKRWVVERSNAWHSRCRRNSKDYERLADSSVSMIQISHIHIMLKKLTSVERPKFNYVRPD